MAERILVVDDEIQITRVLRAALSAQRYDVRTANDPEEALRLFEEWNPDLIVTDLMMPGMTGIDLCRAIRRKSPHPDPRPLRPRSGARQGGSPRRRRRRLRHQALQHSGAPRARPRASAPRTGAIRGWTVEVGDLLVDPAAHTVTVSGQPRPPHAQRIRSSPPFCPQCRQGSYPPRPAHSLSGARNPRSNPNIFASSSASCARNFRAIRRRNTIQTEPWVGYRFLPEGGPE